MVVDKRIDGFFAGVFQGVLDGETVFLKTNPLVIIVAVAGGEHFVAEVDPVAAAVERPQAPEELGRRNPVNVVARLRRDGVSGLPQEQVGFPLAAVILAVADEVQDRVSLRGDPRTDLVERW